MKKEMNKKAQAPGIMQIIIVVLAILVLILIGWFVMRGLTTGEWSIGQLRAGDVQSVVNGCISACGTGSSYDFCQRTRTMTFEEAGTGDEVTVKVTCAKLMSGGTVTATKPADKGDVVLPTVQLECDMISCSA